jgi:hypothetical protein
MNRIIARTHEIETLERKYRSGKSEFVIVWGKLDKNLRESGTL